MSREGVAGYVLTSQARQDIGMVPTRGVGQMSLAYSLPWLPEACPELEVRLREEQSGGWDDDERNHPPQPLPHPIPLTLLHAFILIQTWPGGLK